MKCARSWNWMVGIIVKRLERYLSMHSVAERNPQAKLRSQLFLIALLIVSIAFETGAAPETIIDRELTVIRGDYKEVHYLIPKGTTNARIQGSFTCKGGLNDDVSFFIFTKDQ